MPTELPDFLRLPKEARDAEAERQDRMRRDFHSRARQTGAEIEAARASIIERELKESIKEPDDPQWDRLADVLGAQGRFTEAASTAINPDLKAFYEKAAGAVFGDSKDCECETATEIVGNTRIQLPKYHGIKEVYSMPAGAFGYLVACGNCDNWTFSRSNPSAYSGEPISDLVRLKA